MEQNRSLPVLEHVLANGTTKEVHLALKAIPPDCEIYGKLQLASAKNAPVNGIPGVAVVLAFSGPMGDAVRSCPATDAWVHALLRREESWACKLAFHQECFLFLWDFLCKPVDEREKRSMFNHAPHDLYVRDSESNDLLKKILWSYVMEDASMPFAYLVMGSTPEYMPDTNGFSPQELASIPDPTIGMVRFGIAGDFMSSVHGRRLKEMFIASNPLQKIYTLLGGPMEEAVCFLDGLDSGELVDLCSMGIPSAIGSAMSILVVKGTAEAGNYIMQVAMKCEDMKNETGNCPITAFWTKALLRDKKIEAWYAFSVFCKMHILALVHQPAHQRMKTYFFREDVNDFLYDELSDEQKSIITKKLTDSLLGSDDSIQFDYGVKTTTEKMIYMPVYTSAERYMQVAQARKAAAASAAKAAEAKATEAKAVSGSPQTRVYVGNGIVMYSTITNPSARLVNE